MSVSATFLHTIAFLVLPYVAAATFLLVSVYRYCARPFTYSSLSSQFLENRAHFWALVPFHYGLVTVLAGHLLALLLPKQVLLWSSVPVRLYALEITGLALGLMTVVGLAAAIARRLWTPHARAVTSWLDWVLYAILGAQVVTGVAVAIVHPWGSTWFASAMSPYLRSLVQLRPDINYVIGLPWLVKAHVINAFLLVWLWPFTRLAHVLVVPNPYLWRRPQVVRWYGGAPSRSA